MVKLKILKWEVNLDYLGGPSVVTMVLISEYGRQESQSQEGEVTVEPGKSNALASFGEETWASGN